MQRELNHREYQQQIVVLAPVHAVPPAASRLGEDDPFRRLSVEGPREATDVGAGGVERRQKRSRKATRGTSGSKPSGCWADRNRNDGRTGEKVLKE